jgi:hypothetical protein
MNDAKKLLFVLLFSVFACSDDGSDGPGTNDPNKLAGLYAHWTVDVIGACGGLCWTVHYFFEDGTVLYDVAYDDDVDWKTLACTGSDCRTYTIENDMIRIEDEDPVSFKRLSNSKVEIGSLEFTYTPPSVNLKPSGTYRSFNYVSDPANGTGAGFDIYLTLKGDGTYSERGTGFGYTEDATAIDNQVHSGTYLIDNHHIDFTTSDGDKQTLLFFRPEDQDADVAGTPGMIHIGGRDYLLKD